MGRGVSTLRTALTALLLLVLTGGLWPGGEGRGQSGGQPPAEPQGQPDPAITDLSFELFLDTTVIVTISITNQGTLRASGGSGELLVQGPTDSEPQSVGLFFFGSVEPDTTTRAGGQFSIAQAPDGPYQVLARITNSPGDSDLTNNEFNESFTLLREPQLRPVRVNFAPPFFNPKLVSHVEVQAFIDNLGLQPTGPSQVEVEFAYCHVQDVNETCGSEAFTNFATRTLDLSDPDTRPPGRFVIDTQKELRVREWVVSACLPLVLLNDPASLGCPSLTTALTPGIYIVRVRVDANNALSEADENDNVEFARFTIPGGFKGISNFVVGINGEEARGMLFYQPDDSQLIGVDKREFERIATCVGVRLQPACPFQGNAQAMALIGQFVQATPFPARPGLGTARINVFNSAFETFDQQVKPLILWREDVRPARITRVVQNRSRQVLYVGLSDGRLLWLNFANPSNLQRNVLTVDPSGGEVAALQVIDNGVYVGVNSPNSAATDAQGRVYFVQDKNGVTISSPQVMPTGNRIQKLAVSPSATTLFVTTLQENRLDQPKLQLWWASNIIQNGQLTGLLSPLRQATLENFSGESWNDFVVNARLRGFMSVSDSAGTSQLYAYSFRKLRSNGQDELKSTLLFGPLGQLIDQCDARQVDLGHVRALALGDDTPDVSGDQVLHLITTDNPRVLTLQVQRKNAVTKIIEDVTNPNELLHWWVPVDGAPNSISLMDKLTGRGRNPDGTVLFPNGFAFLPAQDGTVYVVNGQNREPCTNKFSSARLTTGASVVAAMDTGPTNDLDPLTFEQIPGVIAFYASDGVYVWRAQLQDLPLNGTP